MNELTETIMAADANASQGHDWIDWAHANVRASTARNTHTGKRGRPSSHSRMPGKGATRVIRQTAISMLQASHDQCSGLIPCY